jgi:hypothetical protein
VNPNFDAGLSDGSGQLDAQQILVTGGSNGGSALDGLAASAMRFLGGSGTGAPLGGAPPSGTSGGSGSRPKKES